LEGVTLSHAQEVQPTRIAGSLSYSNTFFTTGVAEPEIILEDQGGFIMRDRNFVMSVESQVIGQITSDFYQSPFTYSLTLPAVPQGSLHDVDHDATSDTGVMVFAVAYWTNTWGDPYLERRDLHGGGWSSAYASTRVSSDRESYLEVFGGKYVVYAPDGAQQFPSEFGPDQRLFTADDPIMDLPAGWSVIDMDETPFAIDRSEQPVVDLIEPDDSALDDFSALSYTDAFDAMLNKFATEYAWTDLKQIDWTALAAEFRPRFVAAQANNDPHAYALALRDFTWSIPDSHVGMDLTLLDEDFNTAIEGGLGFAMSETDRSRFIATFITPGASADRSGMRWGAEILAIDGAPTNTVVSRNVPWSSPFSNPIFQRLQQLRYALRFPLSQQQVSVRFRNPDGAARTVKLRVENEFESFDATSIFAGLSPTALPVEFDVLPDGLGYVKITSFFDNTVLTIQLWERALQYFIDNGIPGVIVDMRQNFGGDGWLADQMAAYFFDREIPVGNTAYFDKSSGEFFMDPGDAVSMIPPRPGLQYGGPVALLIGPGCASSCEFFSYDLTIANRAEVVGQYPSQGAGGSVEQFVMPEDVIVQMTIGRAVDPNGNVHIEGGGIVPSRVVPSNLSTFRRLAKGEDVILTTAQEALAQAIGPTAAAENAEVAPVPQQDASLLPTGVGMAMADPIQRSRVATS
jgi:C-terminal processing protease CtpA/Prc